jgi:hypothetical protein
MMIVVFRAAELGFYTAVQEVINVRCQAAIDYLGCSAPAYLWFEARNQSAMAA